MEPEYFWTVYDTDISPEEMRKYRCAKIGFLLDGGFVLKNKPKTAFILGKNSEGTYLTSDLSEVGSMIIAGEDGSPAIGDDESGRYNFTESLVAEYLVNTMADEDRLILIGSRIDWIHCKELPAPYVTVIDNPNEALKALNKLLYSELVDRYMLFESTEDDYQDPVQSIESFNSLMKTRAEKEMPYITVVINNLEELMMNASDDTEEAICRLANMGKLVGINLVVCTRDVSNGVLTDWMKTSIQTRIAFRLKSEDESISVLGTSGAEALKGRGDMLFLPGKGASTIRLQAALLGWDSMDNIIQHYIELKNEIGR